MNTLLSVLVLLALTSLASAATAGPRGGRVLHTEPQKAEFFVTAERRAEITFLDSALKPATPGSQVVSAIAEIPGQRTVVEFDRTESGFVSREVLPESAAPYRVVVQIRRAPGEKPSNHRIELNLTQCGECGYLEYACTCEGH